jgi:hypothetical protein
MDAGYGIIGQALIDGKILDVLLLPGVDTMEEQDQINEYDFAVWWRSLAQDRVFKVKGTCKKGIIT